jgi:hypothetical protein
MADADAAAEVTTSSSLTVVTAYSVDYTPGHVCAARNRHYAVLHDYRFRCWADSNLAMCETILPLLGSDLVQGARDQRRRCSTRRPTAWSSGSTPTPSCCPSEATSRKCKRSHSFADLLLAKERTPKCLLIGEGAPPAS